AIGWPSWPLTERIRATKSGDCCRRIADAPPAPRPRCPAGARLSPGAVSTRMFARRFFHSTLYAAVRYFPYVAIRRQGYCEPNPYSSEDGTWHEVPSVKAFTPAP